MIDHSEWKSSVLRCFDSTDCDCLTCKFIGGNREVETMEHVIQLLDEKLAEAENDVRQLMRALIKMKDERHAD